MKGSSSSTNATPLNSEFPYSWNTSSADSGAQNTSMISASCGAHTSVHRHDRMQKSHLCSLAARRVLPERAREEIQALDLTQSLPLARLFTHTGTGTRTRTTRTRTRMHAHAHIDMHVQMRASAHTPARARTQKHALAHHRDEKGENADDINEDADGELHPLVLAQLDHLAPEPTDKLVHFLPREVGPAVSRRLWRDARRRRSQARALRAQTRALWRGVGLAGHRPVLRRSSDMHKDSQTCLSTHPWTCPRSRPTSMILFESCCSVALEFSFRCWNSIRFYFRHWFSIRADSPVIKHYYTVCVKFTMM